MAHLKYISPAGWDFDRPIAVPIKASSRGLIGAEYFADTTLSKRVLQRDEAGVLLYTATSPGPGVAADRFSVRWRGWR